MDTIELDMQGRTVHIIHRVQRPSAFPAPLYWQQGVRESGRLTHASDTPNHFYYGCRHLVGVPTGRLMQRSTPQQSQSLEQNPPPSIQHTFSGVEPQVPEVSLDEHKTVPLLEGQHWLASVQLAF